MSVNPILQEELEAAQKAWGEGVVVIGQILNEAGDLQAAAAKHVDTFYAYDQQQVLFKPTKAANAQFRGTRDGAISYFVGGNSTFPEDKGFALQPWVSVRFENAGTILSGEFAVAMGNYFFKTTDGQETKVEYTFGYIRGADGTLKINVHHSSLPFSVV